MEETRMIARIELGHELLGDDRVEMDMVLEKREGMNEENVGGMVRAVIEHVLEEVDETKTGHIKEIAIEHRMTRIMRNDKTWEAIWIRMWAEDKEQANAILKSAASTLPEPTAEEREAAKDWS